MFRYVIAQVFLITALVSIIGCRTIYYHGEETKHFKDGRFFNSSPVEQHGFLTVLKWMITRERHDWPEVTESHTEPGLAALGENEIRLTFIGHSSFIIETSRGTFALDPIWSERASPFSWLGPRRHSQPAIGLEKIPPINWVLVSHDHYDHLDLPTLQLLQKKFQSQIFAGLGVDQSIKTEDNSLLISTLDWWQTKKLNDKITITFLPAQHFSGRWLGDRFATLWGSWLIQIHDKTIYFAGDTGYSSHFKTIAEKFPKIDLALLPIGAYEPRWFMKDMHINPEEAVEAHLDLKARKSIGMHFGTFQLTDEDLTRPEKDLEAAKQKFKVAEDEFIVPKFGQQFTLTF